MGLDFPQQYDRVSVLFFSFSASNYDVAANESRLMKIFDEVYNFRVERVQFDARQPEVAYVIRDVSVIRERKDAALGWLVSETFWKFEDKWGGPNSLCIYVYSGHAEACDELPFYRLFESKCDRGKQTSRGPYLNWHRDCHKVVTGYGGRSLAIFNTCYRTPVKHENRQRGPEVLAACGYADEASSSNVNAFSNALADALEKHNGAPYPVDAIYADIQHQLPKQPVYVPGSMARKLLEPIVLQKCTTQQTTPLPASPPEWPRPDPAFLRPRTKSESALDQVPDARRKQQVRVIWSVEPRGSKGMDDTNSQGERKSE